MNFRFQLIALLFISSMSALLADEKPRIFVPVDPYVYLFERVGGDLIEVEAIVGPGDDAHDYSPTPRQVAKIAKATMLCSGELGFEANFFVKVGNGEDAPRAFDLLEGLDLLEGFCDHPSHQPGADPDPDHNHSHDDLKDPHVWLSPKILATQARRVADTLKELVPASGHETIEANLTAFLADLTSLDEELRETLAPVKGKKFYVYHGAFAYFAQDYGLEQVAIEIGNRQPTPKQLAEIVKQAKKDKIQLIFTQPQFDPSSAKSLASTIGGRVASLDPLEKDVLENLRTIATAIVGE